MKGHTVKDDTTSKAMHTKILEGFTVSKGKGGWQAEKSIPSIPFLNLTHAIIVCIFTKHFHLCNKIFFTLLCHFKWDLDCNL